ncbi:MAG TPA: HlyD family efflux transporter periplasmic adaptor subunit [Pirellulales bacterium]|nr:HlyD family efflux transporter periplasmic adaptor subunit [Pirellulales bacterium]
MRRSPAANRLLWSGMAAALLGGLAGCGRPEPKGLQGYVEGEYVYVASPLAGTLESLDVSRGAQVRAGERLFTLESTAEEAARNEAERRLTQARANAEDAKKGMRPSELASLEAQLKQAQAALALAEKDFTRQEKLLSSSATSRQDYDRAGSTLEQDRLRVEQLEADLRTARLGSRQDQVLAAGALVRALEAALAKAQWELSQKSLDAPKSGLVFDTLFREGEWVAAGRPIVVLLPPKNIKVRAFVPETRIAAIKTGDAVRVRVDAIEEPLAGHVSYVSPRAEFTPPVIYSQESRAKLVFMIEVVFDPTDAERLHPGQPVDVYLGP